MRGRQRSKVKTLLLWHCVFRTFHVTDGQTTRDQIMTDRRSKLAWPKWVLCIPYILSGSPNEFWLHTCDACVITTWRLGLLAPLVARKYGKRINLKRLNNLLILVDWVLFSRTKSVTKQKVKPYNFFPKHSFSKLFVLSRTQDFY